MLAAQAEAAGCEAVRTEILPDDPERIAAARARRGRRPPTSSSSSPGRAPGATTTPPPSSSGSGRSPSTASRSARAIRSSWARSGRPPVLGAPGYPVSAALTFDIFAAPVLAALEGAAPAEHPRARARIARKLASSMGMDDWVRVRLGRVGGDLVATPLPRGAGVLTSLVRADGLLVVPAGLEGHHAGTEVDVLLLRGVGEIDRTIVAIGSHDLVLDLAASEMRAADPGVTLASSNVGSLGGLVALRDGLCHIAGSHLLDPETGEYTLPYVDRVLGDADVAIVRLVHREQGVIVAPGNPLGIAGIEDLAQPGLRYVNRQRGAGTRVLLDHELRRRGIAPDAITGYAREEHTHLAVAAAIAAGRADAGPRRARPPRARSASTSCRSPASPTTSCCGRRRSRIRSRRRCGRCSRTRTSATAVEALGGYDTQEMGRRIR